MVSASASQDTLSTKMCVLYVKLRGVSNVITKNNAVSVLRKRISIKIQKIIHASVLKGT
jgi:hypothetical protein